MHAVDSSVNAFWSLLPAPVQNMVQNGAAIAAGMKVDHLKQAGEDEAKALLSQFTKDMKVIENQSYHQLMMLYKGELPADSVLAPSAPIGGSGVAAVAYGVGNWHFYNGRQAEAEAVFRRIMGSNQWASFGYIAAEAELARLK